MVDSVVQSTKLKRAGACRNVAVALGQVRLRFDPYAVPTAVSRAMRIFQGGDETIVAYGLPTAVESGAAHGTPVQETPGDISLVDEKRVLAEIKCTQAGGGDQDIL